MYLRVGVDEFGGGVICFEELNVLFVCVICFSKYHIFLAVCVAPCDKFVVIEH